MRYRQMWRPSGAAVRSLLNTTHQAVASRPAATALQWVVAVLVTVFVLTGRAEAEPLLYAVNGHWYEAVEAPQGITWESAERAASARMYNGMSGHLATITGLGENQFIAAGLPGVLSGGDWLGGFQLPGVLDAPAGWQWITGEPFDLAYWNGGKNPPEPNEPPGSSGGDADKKGLHFDAASALGVWGDRRASDTAPRGFVVEYEPASTLPPPVVTGYTAVEVGGEATSRARPGWHLLIQGQNLGERGTVLFEGVPLPAAVADWSPGRFQVYVPSAPTYPHRGRVTVVSGGRSASGPEFTITAPQSYEDLLGNGGFEVPDSQTSILPVGYTYGLPQGVDPRAWNGYTIPGWRIRQGTIDVIRSYWQPAPGPDPQSIELVGSPGAATIEQTIYTEPGRDYVISGWVAHNPDLSSASANLLVNGRLLQRLRHDLPATRSNMRWIPFSYEFRADSRQTTIRFQDVTGLADDRGIALDGVQFKVKVTFFLCANVPNPATREVYINGGGTGGPWTWEWGDESITTNGFFPQIHRYADISRPYTVTIASNSESYSFRVDFAQPPSFTKLILWTNEIDQASGRVDTGGVDCRQQARPFGFDWGDGTRGEGSPGLHGLHVYEDLTKTYTVTVTAYLGGPFTGQTDTATLTISFPRATLVSDFTLTPASVVGGGQVPVTGTVTLTGPAPAGGARVKLEIVQGNAQVATMPAEVMIPEGLTLATFAFATKPVSGEQSFTVRASYHGARKEATVRIVPPQ